MAEKYQFSIYDINPHVRKINVRHCEKGYRSGLRRVHDYHITYFHSGKGVVTIEDKAYPVGKGDLIYVTPNVKHEFIADMHTPFVISGIHFDYTQDYRDIPFPVASFNDAQFEENKILQYVSFSDFHGFPTKFNVVHNPIFQELIFLMYEEYTKHKVLHNAVLSGYFKSFIILAAREVSTQLVVNKKTDIIVNDIILYIHKNYNQQITNEILSSNFNFSITHINRLMNLHTGYSLQQYIINFRLQKAIELIMNENVSISNAAYAVGFKDIHYFSRLFRKKFGYPPSAIK